MDHDVPQSDAEYLRDLAERIFKIPVMYGVDQLDYENLRGIAERLEKEDKS